MLEILDKYLEIKSLSQTGKVNFKVYVVSNKLYPDIASQRKLTNLFNKYRILEKPIYFDQEDIVIKILDSRTKQINGKVTFVDTQHFEKSNGDLKTIIGAISAKDLIELIKSNDDANLIDEYWLFINPVLLGNGIPLFKNTDNKMKLQLIKSNSFGSGVVCLNYASTDS